MNNVTSQTPTMDNKYDQRCVIHYPNPSNTATPENGVAGPSITIIYNNTPAITPSWEDNVLKLFTGVVATGLTAILGYMGLQAKEPKLIKESLTNITDIFDKYINVKV